jgi:hypothetical protein
MTLSPQALLALVVVGIIAAVLVHEGAHWCAARALGGSDVRVEWLSFKPTVHATLPPSRASVIIFFAAGMLANATAAVGLWLFGSPISVVLGALQAALAITNLVPLRDTDGAKLWALLRSNAAP